MKFETDRIGVWTEETTFEVTDEQVIAFAHATNDINIHHLRAETAPPIFAVVPTT